MSLILLHLNPCEGCGSIWLRRVSSVDLNVGVYGCASTTSSYLRRCAEMAHNTIVLYMYSYMYG